MSFRQIFQKLGFWKSVLSWQEPGQYRARLRGDVLIRVGLAASIGGVLMAIFLVMFAINVDPPHPAYALSGFLFGAACAGCMLFTGESTAGGTVRICQEGITRKRTFIPRIPVHLAAEEVNWPYESFSRAIIVPGQALGQSFSVLLLTDEINIQIVGIPNKISLQVLGEAISAGGVHVEYGSFVPETFTRPLAWPIVVIAGAMGIALALGGLGFYAIKSFDRGGNAGGQQIARAPAVDPPAKEAAFGIVPARDNSIPLPPPQAQPQRRAELVYDPAPASRVSRPPSVNPFDPVATHDKSPRLPLRPVPRAPTAAAAPRNPFARPVAAAPRVGEPGELVGGKGGFSFRAASPDSRPVVGFRYALGTWAGKQALSQFEPLFERNPAGRGSAKVLAQDGYVVGGLELDASEMVHAIRIVFVRQQADGALKPNDSYISDWLGAPTGNPSLLLSSGSIPVTGIHGRKGAVIDALGLVLGQP